MVIAIFPLLLLLFLVVGLSVGLVLWLGNKPAATSENMSCGRCGYAVHGLSDWACPECGADLREAGIKPQGSPGSRRAGIALATVCGVLLLLSCVFSAALLFWASPSSSISSPSTHPSSIHSAPAPSPAAPEDARADDLEKSESDPPPIVD